STQVLYSLRRWHDYEFSWRFNLEGLPPRSRDSYRVAAFWTHTISDRMFFAVSINRYELKSMIGEGGKSSIDTSPYEYDFFLKYVVRGKRNWWAESRQVITTVKADWTTTFSRSHLFKAGGEVNFYDVSADILKIEPQKTFYGKPKPFDPPLNFSSVYNYSPLTGNVYVQDKIETEKNGTILNLGVRYDFLDPRALRPALELIPKSSEEFTQEVREFVPARFKSQFSPRFGLAAPVGVNWYLYVNFGVYFQFPLFEYLYSGLNPVTLSKTIPALLGNPDLEPERTQAWELGVKYLLAQELAVSFTYFQKKSKNLIDTKTLIPSKARIAGDYGFAEYVNSPEANTTGAEIVFSRERGRFVTGSLSYTLMKVEGAADFANQGLNYFEWGFPLFPREYPLSWDQRHTVKVIAELELPFDVTANVVAQYHSGRPYTFYPTKDGFSPLDTTLIFTPNNARMRDSKLVDVKVYKGFTLGSGRTRFWLYLDVRNLLDAKNVRWVDSNGRVGGELTDPSAYGEPRRTRVGIRVEL
ncbi:MAG TPA: TonB-dependent receptor, partial [Bacteroidota bacterium]